MRCSYWVGIRQRELGSSNEIHGSAEPATVGCDSAGSWTWRRWQAPPRAAQVILDTKDIGRTRKAEALNARRWCHYSMNAFGGVEVERGVRWVRVRNNRILRYLRVPTRPGDDNRRRCCWDRAGYSSASGVQAPSSTGGRVGGLVRVRASVRSRGEVVPDCVLAQSRRGRERGEQ